jgi:hypothetical protein
MANATCFHEHVAQWVVQGAFNPEVVSSSLTVLTTFGYLAQLVEQLTLNQ